MFVFAERQALQGMPGRGLSAPSHTPERVTVVCEQLIALYRAIYAFEQPKECSVGARRVPK